MTMWRLEWLRLVRTRRLAVLLGLYAFLGLTGPLTARYIATILERLGTDEVRVQFPTPRPVDGIGEFAGNASQLGVLAVVLVAASALAFDGRREMAVFLRTRVSVRGIVLPAYAMNLAAASAGLMVGTAAAWYETAVLLGPVPAGRMLLGVLYGVLFLAFTVAVTALAAAGTRSTVAAAGVTLAVLLAMAVASAVPSLGRLLPTALANAMTGLVAGTPPADFLPAAAVAAGGAVACVALAIILGSRHEV